MELGQEGEEAPHCFWGGRRGNKRACLVPRAWGDSGSPAPENSAPSSQNRGKEERSIHLSPHTLDLSILQMLQWLGPLPPGVADLRLRPGGKRASSHSTLCW